MEVYFHFVRAKVKEVNPPPLAAVSRGEAKSDLAEPPLDTSRLAAREIHISI